MGRGKCVRGGLPLDGRRELWLDFGLDHWLLWLGLLRRAHLAGAVVVVAVLVGAQPQEMWEELDWTAEALPWSLGVSV